MKQLINSLKSMQGNIQLIILVIAVVLIGGFASYQYYYSEEKVVLRAAEKFTKVKTYHADFVIDMKLDIKNPNDGMRLDQEASMKGAFDIDTEKDSGKGNMSVKVMGISADIDMVILDKEIYMKMPFLTQAYNLQGKEIEWIVMDIEELSKQSGQSYNPEDYEFDLEAFKSLGKDDIEELGSEEVAGHKTIKYKVNIDWKEIFESIKDEETREVYQELFDNADVTTTIWVDKMQDKIVKVEMDIKDMKLANKKQGVDLGTVDMVLTMTYTKYNEPVDIKKPEGDITDYEDLQGGMY